MLAIVTNRPLTLMGVNGSSNTMPAAEMVTTSLKIPQMLNVTTDVRFNRANSEDVIRNASTPGKSRIAIPSTPPLCAVKAVKPLPRATSPSTGMAMIPRVKNIIGARKKMLLNGLLVAGFRSSSICVRAQRKPEEKAEEIIRIKPRALNAVSPATIMTTPTVIVAMMRINLIEGVSRWKRKANRRTNAREEDLHIANENCVVSSSFGMEKREAHYRM